MILVGFFPELADRAVLLFAASREPMPVASEVDPHSSDADLTAYPFSSPVHNVYIGQFFFLPTERGQTYPEISKLLYHLTYISLWSLGREENREN